MTVVIGGALTLRHSGLRECRSDKRRQRASESGGEREHECDLVQHSHSPCVEAGLASADEIAAPAHLFPRAMQITALIDFPIRLNSLDQKSRNGIYPCAAKRL